MKRTGGLIIKRYFLWMVAAFLLTLWDMPSVKAEARTIKIGCGERCGFIEKEDEGYVGYCVDYLDEIAKCTGWKYEFICDSWENCLQNLEKGELDIVCLAQHTKEREKNFLFSEIPMGYEYLVLYTREDSDIYYEDFQAMNGTRIGLNKESAVTAEFLALAEEKGITFQGVYYGTEEESIKALTENEIDIAAASNLHRHVGIKMVEKGGAKPFYCITSKNNEELMDELNSAMQMIKTEEPEIEARMLEKYYSDSQLSTIPSFTKEEATYIKNSGPVRIKLMSGSIPLSYMKDGKATGIFVDYLRLLSEKSGLEFQIEMEETPLTMEQQTQHMLEDDYLMLRSERALESSGLTDGLIASNPLLETHLAYVRRREALTDSDRDDYVLAVTKEMSYLVPLVEDRGKNLNLLYCDSTKECLEAVLDKEADIAVQDSYVISYILQKPIYAEHLAECPGEQFGNGMCLIGSRDQELLIQILNKTIKYVSQEEKNAIVSMHLLMNPYNQSLGDVIYQYWELLLCIVIILVVSVYIYTVLIRRMTSLQIHKKEYEGLQRRVQKDELTGVYNKTYFYEKARDMIDNAKTDMCIVIMDISNFKVVNDLYGMENGDRLLQHMAQELLKLGQGKDFIVSRFNGDHFYMCMSRKDFHEIQFPGRFKSSLEEIDITVSYGVFFVGQRKDIPINIMCDRASLAVHDKDYKQIDYIHYYNDEERRKILLAQEIENDMEKALEERQFCVYVQPKYDIEKSKIVGGEALVRWKHPQKGMIPPGDFIGIFEKNGFIIRLDYFVWEETCRLLSEWKKLGLHEYPISVNVSRAHFYGKELRDKLEELIKKYQLNTSDLELEITETICAEDHEIVYKRIKELRDAGFKVAMDDFGSGYSSLNMLKEIPLDIIKMDLKFLDGGDDEKKSRNILKTLIMLAQSLNLVVVVEGVENKEQVQFLQEIGNSYAQGYYYSRPVDSETYVVMLSKR